MRKIKRNKRREKKFVKHKLDLEESWNPQIKHHNYVKKICITTRQRVVQPCKEKTCCKNHSSHCPRYSFAEWHFPHPLLEIFPHFRALRFLWHPRLWSPPWTSNGIKASRPTIARCFFHIMRWLNRKTCSSAEICAIWGPFRETTTNKVTCSTWR